VPERSDGRCAVRLGHLLRPEHMALATATPWSDLRYRRTDSIEASFAGCPRPSVAEQANPGTRGDGGHACP
jgi:hypothetical protein